MLLLSLVLCACASQPGSAQPGDPVFSIKQDHPDDQITVQVEERGTVIDIASPTGIGSAVFTLESGEMPDAMIVRLYLAGLEQVRVSAGEETVAASVSSSGLLERQDQTLIEAGTETPLLPIHPLWMDIRIVTDGAAPSIPLEQGFFEIELPEALLAQDGDTLEIQWIDFYR
jgi:hypothetical protein